MAIALVGTPVSANNNSAASSIAAPAFDATTGNFILVFVEQGSSPSPDTLNVSDTALNTYVRVANQGAPSIGNIECWIAEGIERAMNHFNR